MSHAHIDHLSDLQCRIADLDSQLAAAKAARVVDIKVLGDLKRLREGLVDEAAKARELAR